MTRTRILWPLAVVLPLALAACGSTPTGPANAGSHQSGSAAGEPQSEAEAPAPLTLNEQANALWEEMTPRQHAASVLMLNYPGADAEAIAHFVEEIQPAGLILMGADIPEDESNLPEIIGEVQSASAIPLLVAVDQEGGFVRRVTTDPTPGAEELRNLDVQETEDAFATRAELLEDLGFNTNFGIVSDVTDDPGSFIYTRVLGLDPDSAADRVAAAVRGEKTHVLSVLKHFPGHGGVAADSHTSLPTTDLTYEQWQSSEAAPFAAGIDAGAEMVMLGHLAYTGVDDRPASLSPAWVEVLRSDFGFQGVLVTDDMKMLRENGLAEYADAGRNAVAALNAGVDLVLDIGEVGVPPQDFANALIDRILAAVENGELPEETLRSAGVRVLEQRLELGG